MKIFVLVVLLMTQASLVFTQTILTSNYQTWSAAKKRQALWDEIIKSQYDLGNLPTHSLGPGDAINLLSPKFLRVTVLTSEDEMPVSRTLWGSFIRRPKVVHKNGSTALVKWIPTTGHEYTGLFQTGGTGILRASLAGTGFTPGLAVKWLLNGNPSLNVQLMNTLDPQTESCNYFERNFSNSLPEPKNPFFKFALGAFLVVAKEFQGSQATGGYLPLSHWGRAYGDSIGKTPHHIVIIPSEKAQALASDCDTDFRVQFAPLQPGDTLYHVYGYESEHSEQGVWLGNWELESNFVPSEFGDKVLHFQHHLSL